MYEISLKDKQRFIAKIIVQENGCWYWQGGRDKKGYGKFWWDKQTGRAPRFAYIAYKGSIPENLELDHLCRTTCCVNPDCLEAVTRKENLRRGESPVGLNYRKKYCIHGHAFTEENTLVMQLPDGPERSCRTCTRERMRAIRAKRAKVCTGKRPYRRKYNSSR